MVGLLDDAAEHGDQWLAHARAKGDVTNEARALSLRMRIAFDVGDLPGMARFTDELIATVDQVPVRRGPRPGDDLRRAVPPAPRPRRPHLRVGRQGARDRHAQRVRRRAPRRDGGEGLGAHGRAGLGRRGPGPPRGGRRGGGPHRRRRPRRPGARTARVAGPGVEPPRRRPRCCSSGCASTPRSPGSTGWPPTPASRPPRRSRPPTATSTPPSRCSSNAAATIRAPPRPATADGCRCCAPGLALEAGDLRAAAELTEAAKPVTPRSQVGRVRPRRPPRRPAGRPRRGPRAARAADPGHGRGGLRGAVAGARPAGRVPRRRDGSRRAAAARRARWASSRATALDADHPFRQLIDAQLAEGDGDIEAAARLYAAAAEQLHRRARSACSRATGAPPTSARPGASSRSASLDDARSARGGGGRAAEPVARVARRRAASPSSAGSASAASRPGRPSSRPASGRWPRSSPRGSATPAWPSGSTSPRAPRPCTCRTSCRSSAWHRAPRWRRGRPARGSPATAEPRQSVAVDEIGRVVVDGDAAGGQDRQRQRHELVAADRAGPAATRRP